MTRGELLDTFLGTDAFPHGKWTPGARRLYEGMLVDFPDAIVHTALVEAVTTATFRPTVGELRTICLRVVCGELRSGEEAFEDVTAQIDKTGYVGRPVFEDPIVAEIVGRMGWRRLCASVTTAADRAMFARLYDREAGRAQRELLSGRAALPSIAVAGELLAGEDLDEENEVEP